jgi:hypothetical protein
MKILTYPILLALFFCACNSNNDKKKSAEDVAASISLQNDLLGNWVGFLGDNKVNIRILGLNEKSVVAKSICAGNERKLKGEYETSADKYTFTLAEPGTDNNDGVFNFFIDKNTHQCTGVWTPNDKSKFPKNFTCQRVNFSYNKSQGDYPQTSRGLLKEDDLLNFTKDELSYMRNEIYARHGYSFKKKDIRQQFDKLGWYVPMSADVRSELTDVEKKNADLLKSIEKYASDNYEDFGR